MLSLEGRVAIVTGGAQGIGRATVMALADAGAKIALTNIRCAKLDQTIQELKDMGREALKFCVDVTDVEAVQEMVDQTIATWGKIDILVNNAGITKDNLVMRMKTADWEAVLKTNLDGTFYCTRAVLPYHGPAALGAHHQHRFRGGADRKRGPSELYRFQSGHHRPHQGRGRGGGPAQHHGERHCPGLYRHSHDRGSSSGN